MFCTAATGADNLYTPQKKTPTTPPPLLVGKGRRIRLCTAGGVHFPFINWHFIRVLLSRNQEQSWCAGSIDEADWIRGTWTRRGVISYQPCLFVMRAHPHTHASIPLPLPSSSIRLVISRIASRRQREREQHSTRNGAFSPSQTVGNLAFKPPAALNVLSLSLSLSIYLSRTWPMLYNQFFLAKGLVLRLHDIFVWWTVSKRFARSLALCERDLTYPKRGEAARCGKLILVVFGVDLLTKWRAVLIVCWDGFHLPVRTLRDLYFIASIV